MGPLFGIISGSFDPLGCTQMIFGYPNHFVWVKWDCDNSLVKSPHSLEAHTLSLFLSLYKQGMGEFLLLWEQLTLKGGEVLKYMKST